uniref:NADH dehydrogenase subunit 2 n=1 Tax=Echinolaelaps fukienensis TaxID=2902762 RepID=UPI0030E46585
MAFSWMKMLSYVMIIMSYMIMLFSESFFLLWFSFELNLLSFMYIMWEGKGFCSVNSMMKYFIIQSFSSIIFLVVLMLSEATQMLNLMLNIVSIIMMMKIGLFPFSFWLPDVVEGLSWESMIIFLTGQKIIPMYVIMMMDFYYSNIVITMTMLFGLFMMYNQISLRKFLIYSSLIHSGWLLVAVKMHFMYFMFYLMIYFIMLLMLVNMENLDSMLQFKYLSQTKISTIFFTFMNLSGLPPFLGFFSKIFIMVNMNNNNIIIIIILIMGSMISSYIYMNYVMMIFYNKSFYKNYLYNYLYNYYIIMCMLMMLFMIMHIMNM